MSLRVHFFTGGFCRHLLATVDRRSFRFVRFHAVFLALEHPRLGWIVCDTGYSDRFFAATARWPYRLYRWATPVTLRGRVAGELQRVGLQPADIRHLLVTHFHADHVGGLHEFPHAHVYHHAGALAPLQALSPWRQTRAAFLPALVPADLATRATAIPPAAFGPDPEMPFATCDLFGDGVIKLVDLPGHAPGQIGLVFDSGAERIFYCADAFWRAEQLVPGVDLPWLTRQLQWDPAAYRTTLAALRSLAATARLRLLACHDAVTCRYVVA